MTDPEVLILGADVEGLTAALRIAAAGRPVLVADPAETVGGPFRPCTLPDGRTVPLLDGSGLALAPSLLRLLSEHEIELPVAAPGALMASAGEGPWLTLPAGPALRRAALREQTPGDADGFAALEAALRRSASILAASSNAGEAESGVPPEGTWLWEALALAEDSLAALLPRYVKTPLLQTALAGHGLADAPVGPYAAGSALHLMARWALRPHVLPAGGVAALCAALAERVIALGGEIRLGTDILRTEVKNGRVARVHFSDGSRAAPRQLVSALDPKRTVLTLFDWKALPPQMVSAAADMSARGHIARCIVELTDPAAWRGAFGLSGPEPLPVLTIAPGLEAMEQAYDRWRRRMPPEGRVLTVYPVTEDTVIVAIPYTIDIPLSGAWTGPMRDALLGRALATVERAAPGVQRSFGRCHLLLPQDFEAVTGASGGEAEGLSPAAENLLLGRLPAALTGGQGRLRNLSLISGRPALRRLMGQHGARIKLPAPQGPKRRLA